MYFNDQFLMKFITMNKTN